MDQINTDYSHQVAQQSRVSRTLAGVCGLSVPTFREFLSLQANVAFAVRCVTSVADIASLRNLRYNTRRHSLLFNDAVSTPYVARRVTHFNIVFKQWKVNEKTMYDNLSEATEENYGYCHEQCYRSQDSGWLSPKYS